MREYDFLMLMSVLAIGLVVFAQSRIGSNYRKYSRMHSNLNLTGADVAREILRRNNVQDIQVVEVGGQLSDHFNPQTGTVNLSREVYSGTSIASVSIAAHEIGHVLQYENDYVPIKLRAGLVGIANMAGQFAIPSIILGSIISPMFYTLGVALLLGSLLFQVVTLPVEINASRRAMTQLNQIGLQSSEEGAASSMLKAAAMTYIAGTFATLTNLLRILYMGKRRD